MPRRKTFDVHDALVQVADLFWEQGFTATSMEQISDLLGLKKSSIYNAFGDKASLFRSAADAYIADIFVTAAEFLKGKQPVSTELSAFLTHLLVEQEKDVLDRGCLVVNSLLELSHAEPELYQHIHAGLIRITDALTAYFVMAQSDGRLHSDADPHALVAFMMAVFQGMRVQAKTKRDIAYRTQIIAMAMTAIRVAEPANQAH